MICNKLQARFVWFSKSANFQGKSQQNIEDAELSELSEEQNNNVIKAKQQVLENLNKLIKSLKNNEKIFTGGM